MERPHYDTICVGAGPAGACLGYYMGKKGRKVLLLDKATFPRDKICGDALCKTGIEIIHEMGVYEELKKENKINIVRNSYSREIVNIVRGLGPVLYLTYGHYTSSLYSETFV